MSSHEEQLKADFKTIFPELNVSSSRMRIMARLAADAHLVARWAALWQLASNGADVTWLPVYEIVAIELLNREQAPDNNALPRLNLVVSEAWLANSSRQAGAMC
ncbi:hypothetical protein [Stenotrophomonas maltophilia]|uniref:hypothetical protein n=1 Tax=Stenotrophomonas maltophilia TaxID=40324 RepID=UPI00050A234F|nr:hypothetical protein [Stenotrophomonas maltophilia]KGM25581.1 hypothetical protein LI87_0100370 [Stenotrophomonas maltophilia]